MTTQRPPDLPSRLHSLDALRGLAALSVVFWHWQHFFYRDGVVAPFDHAAQPLYGLLFIFYESGWIAVDLFFTLSGFVFFWLYASAVRDRRVGARDFFVLRFSRLYPLHLATLLLVLGGLTVFHISRIRAFTYPDNDVRHFVLNLFLASNWGFERGLSFNAPVWSISIEVLLYALFFVLCRWVDRTLAVMLVLILVGLNLTCFTSYWLQGRGVFSFFLGGLSFFAYRRLARSAAAGAATALLAGLAGAGWLWVVIAYIRHPGFLPPFELPVSYEQVRALGARALANDLGRLVVTGLVFPLTLIALALLETRYRGLGRRLSPLGDISYSSYLLHFPVQMLFYGVAVAIGVEATFFRTDAALLLFMATLLALSFASHRWLERPAQRALRERFLVRGSRSQAPARATAERRGTKG